MSRAESADEALAQRVAAAMFQRDRAAHSLGVEIIEVRVGFARASLVVREDMLNGHAVCHGGYVFALADSAFAYACNTRDDVNVALQCSISFTAPGRLGDRLEATARERIIGGRTGLYDVEVLGAGGEVVAFFRGTSYRTSATVL